MKTLTKEEFETMTGKAREFLVPGDILDDEGRWSCPECGGYKYLFISDNLTKYGWEAWQWCICKCQRKKLDDERLANKRRELRFRCFPNRNQHEMTFDRDSGVNPAVSAIIKKYAENFDEFQKNGQGLLLYGEPGTGKSYMACAVANALIDRCRRVKFYRIETLFRDYLSSGNKNGFLTDITCNDLVILDDLGVETPQMKTFLFTLFDALYVGQRPFIVTTNLGIDAFKNPEDKYYVRVFSRILERCPYPVYMSDEKGNARIKKIRSEHQKYKEMLGIA